MYLLSMDGWIMVKLWTNKTKSEFRTFRPWAISRVFGALLEQPLSRVRLTLEGRESDKFPHNCRVLGAMSASANQ
jgi:hypothetical protein